MIYYALIISVIVHVLAGVAVLRATHDDAEKTNTPIEISAADIAPVTNLPTKVARVKTPPAPARPVKAAPQMPTVSGEQVLDKSDRAAAPSTVAVPSTTGPAVDGPVGVDYKTALWAAIESVKEYPALARSRRQTGKVKIAFTLEKDGSISDVHVSEHCEYAVLDQAAIDTLRRLGKFKPIPDAVSLTALNLVVPLNFKLNN